MTLSEAKTIRAEIVKTCPAGHKARNISKRVMQSLMNEREDIVFATLAGRFDHLAEDYEIDERYATQLIRAKQLASQQAEKKGGVKMKILIIDNSNYKSETCNNGGDYSFTTIYTLRPDNKFDVTFSTSAEFQYCHLCGTFYHGDSCHCGMEHPDVVDCENVNKGIAYAMERVARGEELEIMIED